MPEKEQLIWLFFRFKGRVGRAAFFLGGLLLAVIQAFLLYRFTLVPETSTAGQAWALAFWAAFGVSIWSNAALGVKRLHDMDKPGYFAVALFFPVFSFVIFIWLCFWRGTEGPNRFGTRPDEPARH